MGAFNAGATPMSVVSAYKYKTLSASGLVATGDGVLIGILVSSSSSGTLKVWDNTSAATTVIVDTTDTITAPTFIAMPFAFSVGCYVTIGGTAKITVAYRD